MNTPGNEKFLYKAANSVSRDTATIIRARSFPRGSLVFPKIGAAIATNKKRVLGQESIVDNNVMVVAPKSSELSHYIYHYFQIIDLRRIANDSGAVPSIRKSAVEDIRLPLPDENERRKIVHILDLFEKLIVDLSAGIPAEIEARRKQYEYYRDKLLTFKEKES